jgi:transcriptional regulator with XRE-family HTH domain
LKLDPEQLGQHRRELAITLKGLRRASGLSGEALGKRIGMSQSKISKIETGRLLPAVLDVERILTALQVDEETSERLLVLARAANTEFRSWRSYQRFGLHHKQRELAVIEGGSKSIRFFLPAALTGLLHTPEYARASLYRPVTSVSDVISANCW